MAIEGLNYSWKICSRPATTAERKRVFRISTRAIIIKDENCEMNLFCVSRSYDTVCMSKRKFYGCLVNKAGSFGCSEILTQFVREIFLKASFFGVRSFGLIFGSDQLW